MSINEAECKEMNLDIKEVTNITKGLERYLKRANKLGLTVFGGTGTLSLRIEDGSGNGKLIVADCDSTNVDGGCGSHSDYGDGFIRGE